MTGFSKVKWLKTVGQNLNSLFGVFVFIIVGRFFALFCFVLFLLACLFFFPFQLVPQKMEPGGKICRNYICVLSSPPKSCVHILLCFITIIMIIIMRSLSDNHMCWISYKTCHPRKPMCFPSLLRSPAIYLVQVPLVKIQCIISETWSPEEH